MAMAPSKSEAAPLGAPSAASSRSTSPGSSRPLSARSHAQRDGCQVPYIVRNTFIDTALEIDSLLERDVVSCPARKVGSMWLGTECGSHELPALSAVGRDFRPDEVPSSQCSAPLVPAPSLAASVELSVASDRRPPRLSISIDPEAPSLYIVRNTFIEDASDGPSLLDAAACKREILSCPASKIGSMALFERSGETLAAAATVSDTPLWPPTPMLDEPLNSYFPDSHFDLFGALQASALGSVLSQASVTQPVAATSEHATVEVPPSSSDYVHLRGEASIARHGSAQLVDEATDGGAVSRERQRAQPARVLQLADALADTEPKLGSPELPTVGSASHHLGACKPCAFFHKQGCTNSVQCAFCHICGSGEKRRRQKEKKAQLKAMREAVAASR